MPQAPQDPNDEARNQRVVAGLKPGHGKSSPAKLLAHPGEDDENDDRRDDAIHWPKPAPIDCRAAEKLGKIQCSYGGEEHEEQRIGPPLDANSPDQEAAKQFPNAALATFNGCEDDPRR